MCARVAYQRTKDGAECAVRDTRGEHGERDHRQLTNGAPAICVRAVRRHDATSVLRAFCSARDFFERDLMFRELAVKRVTESPYDIFRIAADFARVRAEQPARIQPAGHVLDVVAFDCLEYRNADFCAAREIFQRQGRSLTGLREFASDVRHVIWKITKYAGPALGLSPLGVGDCCQVHCRR